MYPQVLAIIQVNFADQERAKALGIFGSVIGIAAVAGQILGGTIIALDIWHLEWRPIFLVNVPLALATIIAAALHPAEGRTQRSGRSRLGRRRADHDCAAASDRTAARRTRTGLAVMDDGLPRRRLSGVRRVSSGMSAVSLDVAAGRWCAWSCSPVRALRSACRSPPCSWHRMLATCLRSHFICRSGLAFRRLQSGLTYTPTADRLLHHFTGGTPAYSVARAPSAHGRLYCRRVRALW